MIFINDVIAEHLKTNESVIVFKFYRRHATGNREEIKIRDNNNKINKFGKCIVRPVREDIITEYEYDLKKTLKLYVANSGFNNVDEWFKFIDNDLQRDDSIGGYLYKIERLYLYDWD